MKKITLCLLLFLSIFSFAQTVSVTVTELKVRNLDATTINFGTNVQSVNVSIKASVTTSYNPDPSAVGKLGVYCKKNSSTATTPIIPTNGFDANFKMLNGRTETRTFKITLNRSDFDNTGGYVYVQYDPPNANLVYYKSSNIIVTKLPDPITNNIITGDQTLYQGDSASTISGSTPEDGNLTYTYTWQQRTISGAWTNIPGANSRHYSPGIPLETTSYRRIVASAGTGNSTSNEVTIEVIPVYPIQNNTIILSGSDIQGSTPTGGTGSFRYKWYAYILEGEDPLVIEQTTKDWNIPANIYQFMEDIGASQGFIVREVRSGNRISNSNFVTIFAAQPLSNNVITLSGQNIIGSLPTGGIGSFKYEYNVYNEFPDGEIVDGVSSVGNNQNYTGVVQGNFTTKYYRIVTSGNKISYSNTITIPALSSFAKSASTNPQTASTDLTAYPNPASESINFSTNFTTDKEIEIVLYSENLGNEKSVFKGKVTPNQVVNWNIPSSYQKGIYFYKIISDNKEVKTGKVIFK